MYEDITLVIEDPVATITLNRPKQLNAWTDRMGKEVRHALATAESDPRVVGIVVTGAGSAFCAGRDMNDASAIASGAAPVSPNSELERVTLGDQNMPRGFQLSYAYFASVKKPVIAAINGAVAGMALPIVAFCDVRFGSPQAMFKTAFPERGLIAEWGLSWILPRLVGVGHAMDIVMSSRKVDAVEAERIGLLNRRIEGQDVAEYARDYVRTMARQCSPQSLAVMKRQIYEDLERGLEGAMDNAYPLMKASSKGPDFREGVRSFMERRQPSFQRIGANG